MPELPEVETVRRGLERLFGATSRIDRIELRRADLRAAIPRDLPARLAGAAIIGVRRRAKYLLIDTPRATLLSHLGMTGTWRLSGPGDERVHDHCYLHLADGRRLAFRDPRRFGLIGLVEPHGRHPLLDGLGPEPLDADAFTGDVLAEALRGREAPVKALIMDQRIVVGVGNIYAQEALFGARIRPTRAAGGLRRARLHRLVDEIRAVLRAAIDAGGSTISDFRHAGGDSGYFQHRFRVYERAGLPCAVCSARLRSGVIAGRSTVWCASCQT